MKHVRITVSGLVQGVFFRCHAREVALKWGIKGYVRNLGDGRVFLEAEGGETFLRELITWCHHGPARAVVEKVEYEFSEATHSFVDFSIRL